MRLTVLVPVALVMVSCTSVAVVEDDDATALCQRGFEEIESNDYRSALNFFTEAIELDPYCTEAYAGRGIAYSIQYNYDLDNRDIEDIYDLAERDLDRALELDRECGKAYIGLSMLAGVNGEFNEALELAEKGVLLEPQWQYSYTRRGSIYGYLGMTEEALTDFGKSLELDPENAFVHFRRACVYLSDPDEWELALEDLTSAIELSEGDESFLRQAFYKRARIYMDSLGEPELAIADLNRAIELYPENSSLYSFRSEVRICLGDLESAAEDLTRVMELDQPISGTLGTRLRRSWVLLEMGEYESVIADVRLALKLNPYLYMAYIYRCEAYQRLGLNDDALMDANSAIELDPDNALGYYHRGCVLAATGDCESAIADLDHAIELDPDYGDAFYLRAQLKEELGDATGALLDYSESERCDN